MVAVPRGVSRSRRRPFPQRCLCLPETFPTHPSFLFLPPLSFSFSGGVGKKKVAKWVEASDICLPFPTLPPRLAREMKRGKLCNVSF